MGLLEIAEKVKNIQSDLSEKISDTKKKYDDKIGSKKVWLDEKLGELNTLYADAPDIAVVFKAVPACRHSTCRVKVVGLAGDVYQLILCH